MNLIESSKAMIDLWFADPMNEKKIGKLPAITKDIISLIDQEMYFTWSATSKIKNTDEITLQFNTDFQPQEGVPTALYKCRTILPVIAINYKVNMNKPENMEKFALELKDKCGKSFKNMAQVKDFWKDLKMNLTTLPKLLKSIGCIGIIRLFNGAKDARDYTLTIGKKHVKDIVLVTISKGDPVKNKPAAPTKAVAGSVSSAASAKKQVQSVAEPKTLAKSLQWLSKYIRDNKKTGLTDQIISDLKPFRKSSKYTLYRGVSWTEEGFKVWKKFFPEYPFEKGEIIGMNNKLPTGWSTDLDVAKKFSTGHQAGAYGKKGSGVSKYWVIFVIEADKEILCDPAALPEKYIHINEYDDEKEVIILPAVSFKAKVFAVGEGVEELKAGWPEAFPPPGAKKAPKAPLTPETTAWLNMGAKTGKFTDPEDEVVAELRRYVPNKKGLMFKTVKDQLEVNTRLNATFKAVVGFSKNFEPLKKLGQSVVATAIDPKNIIVDLSMIPNQLLKDAGIDPKKLKDRPEEIIMKPAEVGLIVAWTKE